MEQNMNNHYLVIDISNIAHMCKYQNKDIANEPDQVIVNALTIHVMMNLIKKYYNKLRPTQIVLAFDKHNWRVDYTKSDKCVSGNIYKGDRYQNLTESEKEARQQFKEMLTSFEELFHKHTGIPVLAADGCEADDLIAFFVEKYGIDSNITILSSDKDYAQCLTSPNIKLLNPAGGKYRTLEEWDHDLNWHKFFKFIRAGEDGIKSAFPRVRKTRLLKAFNDDFEMANLLQEKFTDQNGKTFIVGELYKENCLLMDLSLQPDYIRDIMTETIESSMDNPGKYSHFHFQKFCGQYKLENIAKQLDLFIPLLKG